MPEVPLIVGSDFVSPPQSPWRRSVGAIFGVVAVHLLGEG
jgi:hypothetical protein